MARLRRSVKLIGLLVAELNHERRRILFGLDVPRVSRQQQATEDVLRMRELRANNMLSGKRQLPCCLAWPSVRARPPRLERPCSPRQQRAGKDVHQARQAAEESEKIAPLIALPSPAAHIHYQRQPVLPGPNAPCVARQRQAIDESSARSSRP